MAPLSLRTAAVPPKVLEYSAPGRSTPPRPEYVTFAELAALLWRRRALILLALAAGAAIGLGSAFLQTRIYQARTSFEIRMPNEDYLNRRQLDPNVESGIILMEPFLQTQIKLLQSDTLLLQVAGKLRLAGLEEFRGRPGFWRSWLGLPAPGPLTRGALLEAVRSRLNIRLATQTQVVEILFESRDPKLAALFANEMAEAYQSQSLHRRIRATSQTGELLARQIEGLQSALRTSERELQDFVTSSGLLSGPERDSVEEARLRQLQTMLTAATDARVAEQSRFDQTKAEGAEALADVLESESLRTYRTRLTDLRQKFAEASQIYKPMHFRVRQIQAEIAEVEQALHRERDGVLARQRGAYRAAEQRESALRKDYDSQAAVAARQSARFIRYTALKNQVETQRQLYDATLRKVKEAEVASTMQASNVLVIDAAAVPERPVKPKKPFYLALGAAVGAFLGVILAFVRERKAVTLQVAPQLPPLASVPLPRAVSVAGIRAPSPAGELHWRKVPSPAAETFHQVLSSILADMESGNSPRMIVFTSVCGDEDRTAVCCNLAIALAESKRRVLLIDADRFTPRVHAVLGVSNDFGFSDLLAPSPEAAAVNPLSRVSSTEFPGLYVLPSGGAIHKLPELLADGRGTGILERLREAFDIVIVDAAPVLSAAEVHVLGRLGDGVVMVIRGNWTVPYLLKAATNQLASNRVRVIGTIDNI